MPAELLAPQTAAGVTPWQTIDTSNDMISFSAPGLAGAETAVLQYRANDGTAYDAYEDDAVVAITATHRVVTVVAPGYWRISKGATAAAVGVEVSTPREP